MLNTLYQVMCSSPPYSGLTAVAAMIFEVFCYSNYDGMFVCLVAGVCRLVIPNPVLTDAIGPTGSLFVNGISRTDLLKM